MCLDVFSVPFLLEIQTKTGQVRDPLEWLALFYAGGQEDIVLEDCRIIAELRPRQWGVYEMVILIRGSVVLCRNIKTEGKDTEKIMHPHIIHGHVHGIDIGNKKHGLCYRAQLGRVVPTSRKLIPKGRRNVGKH